MRFSQLGATATANLTSSPHALSTNRSWLSMLHSMRSEDGWTETFSCLETALPITFGVSCVHDETHCYAV